MNDEKEVIVPSLKEFEDFLFEVSQEGKQEVFRLFEQERLAGRLAPDGTLGSACGRGSAIMILKKRSPLYKFFKEMMVHPDHFYSVYISGNTVSLSIFNMTDNVSYLPMYAAYGIVVKRLKEKYNWQIYNTVDLD
jgi:hypothetical protein